MEETAAISLLGVIVGSVTSILASVALPWLRDSLDRRRLTREQLAIERRTWLMSAITALIEFRAAAAKLEDRASAQARFGTALNQLTVRLTPQEQPIVDVLLAMLAMVQRPRPGVESMVAEAMVVLTLWARGDVRTDAVIFEVERRAAVKFSEDRSEVIPVPPVEY